MAQMHTRIPVARMQHGELLVYQAMSRLPQDWVIFHSCKEDYLEEGRFVHFEADFVLIIPGRGIAVIEVKDWPQVQVTNGRWQSRRHDDEPWKTHTRPPLEQAEIALQKLMRSLTRCGCLPREPHRWPEHRHLAILTRGEPMGHQGSNIPFDSLYLCGTDALRQLQSRIKSLFTLSCAERMTPRRVTRITEALAPSVRFRMSLDNYMQEMDTASANILDLLPALSECTGGIRVEGCAGTGKTIMACAEAARLAAAFPRNNKPHVLMLCFNHAMAYELRQNPLVSDFPEQILVSTFHDFCITHILEPHGLAHLANFDGPGDRLPDSALEAIRSLLPGAHHFEAILVDEAQDFRGVWWQIIRALLAPDGRLFIFADRHQDLYGRYDQLPPLPTRVRLNANLRNARQIAGFSRAMLPADSQHISILPMNGDDICLSPPADTPEERAAEVTRIIDDLLSRDSGIRPCDIVVLSPWRPSHPRCCLNLVARSAPAPAGESPQQAAMRRADCRRPDSTRIFASTIKSFKGQESAYVIITDIIGLDESRGFDMKELYTACTRARFGLFIVPTTTGHSLVNHFSASSAS